MAQSVEKKTCSKCKKPKPPTEFYKRKDRGTGTSKCRECFKSYYQANREREIARNMNYYEDGRYPDCPERRSRYDQTKMGKRDPLKPWPSAICSYSAAHIRVKRVRGRASSHDCADCGLRAQDWSYRGGSTVELTEWLTHFRGREFLAAYSPDPDDYDPRCKSCHTKFDKQNA